MPKHRIIHIDDTCDEIHVYTENDIEVGCGVWHKPYDLEKVIAHIIAVELEVPEYDDSL